MNFVFCAKQTPTLSWFFIRFISRHHEEGKSIQEEHFCSAAEKI